MAARIQELLEASERYQARQQARAAAPADEVEKVRARQARTYATYFAPAARLPALERTLVAVPAPAPAAAGAAGLPSTAPVGVAAAPGIPPLLALDEAGREIITRDNDLRPVRYLEVALLAARPVGKVTVRGVVSGEEGDATGFLVAPGLLLTNHHVLPTAADAAAAFVTFDVEERLDGLPKDPRVFVLQPESLYVSDKALDYAFVAVAPRTAAGVPVTDYGYLRLFERTGKLDPTQRQAANIIQHPLGQPKRIAIRDNYFEEVPADLADEASRTSSLYYGTDTLKGSSGSPVCSDDWFVVALHRGGVPWTEVRGGQTVVLRLDGTPARDGDARSSIRYRCNEGTRVSRIYASLRARAEAEPAAAAALERITAVARDPRLGPVDQATMPLAVAAGAAGAEEGGEEEKLTRRKPALYEKAAGYQPTFLGKKFRVGLPTLGAELLRDAARLKGSTKVVVPYDHFSLVVNARRRTAFYAAANVDGARLWKAEQGKRPPRPQWTLDPRLDESVQPDDAIFSQAMQRGHLYKREDVWSEAPAGFSRADMHSFTITNATPMIAAFNNQEWGDLEDLITRHLEAGQRVSYFAGPIFDVDDRYFNELRKGVPAAERKKGMRIPSAFWKVVAWVEDGTLRAAGFVLNQVDEIRAHGPITEEIDFGAYRQRPITEIQDRTGLAFPECVAADTHPAG